MHPLKTIRVLRAVGALGALAVATFAATPALATGNLLVNGNAEASPAPDDGSVVPVSGWTVTGGTFTIVTYNPSFGGPTATSPGPVDRGLNYFAGGPSAAVSSAQQVIDLTPYQPQFASSPFVFTLSGWFGGYSSQNDNAVLSVSFRDASDNEIEFASTTAVFAADRQNVTGLVFASTGWTADNNVHINPASAVVTLTLTRTDGTYNDGYADNLSFSVGAPVPEPAAWALMGVGLGVLALRRRR